MSSSDTQVILSDENDEEMSGCGRSLPCNPKRRLHRYLVLILICFLSFGSYFCYDNPAALEDVFMTDMSLNAGSYIGFYSWYSWPNVVLSMVGGFLIDRVFGIRMGAIIFSVFVVAGQLFFAAGAYVNSYILCAFGRFVFGVGGESLAVTQNTYASAWFAKSELNFIFGLQLSMSRIGSTVNMNTMELLYNKLISYNGYQRLGVALFIASVTCIFSLFCAIFLAGFDLRAERILRRKKTAKPLKVDDEVSIDVPDVETISLSDIRYFPISFWLICGICVAYYVAVFPFISLSKVFLIQKYDLPGTYATLIVSLIYIVSAACSPVSGFLIDLTGKNLFWVLAGTGATLGCHALFSFTFATPLVVMVLFGVSYSVLASALWPMVALVLPLHQRGTGFGIMQSVQNLGLAVVSIVAGAIQDSHGFLILEVFFSICLCLALLLIVLLYLWDVQNGHKLNMSGARRRAYDSLVGATGGEVVVSQTLDSQ